MRGGAGIYFGHSGVTYWLPVSSEVTGGYCPQNHGAFLCLNTSFPGFLAGVHLIDSQLHLVSRTFVQTSRCGVGFHTFHHCLFPPSVCCLPRAKRPCIMYEGEGGPFLNLNVFTISFNHCGLWGFRKWIESCIQTLYFMFQHFSWIRMQQFW